MARARTPATGTAREAPRSDTLILHRDNSRFVPVGHGRYLAEHIAGSRYVEHAPAVPHA